MNLQEQCSPISCTSPLYVGIFTVKQTKEYIFWLTACLNSLRILLQKSHATISSILYPFSLPLPSPIVVPAFPPHPSRGTAESKHSTENWGGGQFFPGRVSSLVPSFGALWSFWVLLFSLFSGGRQIIGPFRKEKAPHIGFIIRFVFHLQVLNLDPSPKEGFLANLVSLLLLFAFPGDLFSSCTLLLLFLL